MGWVSEQSIYKRERESFMKSSWAVISLQEQEDILYSHIDAVEDAAIRVNEILRNEGLKEDFLMQTRFFEFEWPECGFYLLTIVLRDDGFVYFGLNKIVAMLGLGGRFKDGQFEFYDQYKDQIDDVGTKYEK